MAEISFPLENTDYGAEEAQLWFSGRKSGVFAADELAVNASEGMNVILREGRAWMAYTKYAGVVYANTVALQMTIPTSDAYHDRIDRIVIRFDRTANTIKAIVISGTPASRPSEPQIIRNNSTFDLSVAQIRVKKGATEIASADIEDERLNESVCGLMEDGVTGIPTSMFQAQWDALLKQLKEAMDNVQGGSVLSKIKYSLFFPASGWIEQQDGSFTQQATAEGMLSSDSAIVDVDMSVATVDTFGDMSDAWSAISRAQTQNGSLLLTAFDGAPEIDLTVKVEVFR